VASEKPEKLERVLRRLKLVEAGESFRDVYKSASYYTARNTWRNDVSYLIRNLVIIEQKDEVQQTGVQQPDGR
jgi:hypothetical protein